MELEVERGGAAVAEPECGGPEAPPVAVRVHPALCVGWGECHRRAPDIYPLDSDGHVDVHLLDVPAEHAEDAWWGAYVCPRQAITVIGPPEAFWYDLRRWRLARLRREPWGGTNGAGDR